mmetsp:Transcript_8063/g.9252  ORF Transcript_8063/g.9252 Transcript_8063/m.9252 type:complete len:141 (+) Transcript_8063:360-782(+)
MGYTVGYSTTNAASKLELTPLEKILRKIPSVKSLEVLSKICRNISQNPNEPKYRKLRLANKMIKANIVDVDNCIDFLTDEGIGFVEDNSDDEKKEKFLVLPASKKIKFTIVQSIEKAIDYREKEDENQQKQKAKIRKISA